MSWNVLNAYGNHNECETLKTWQDSFVALKTDYLKGIDIAPVPHVIVSKVVSWIGVDIWRFFLQMGEVILIAL